LREASETVLLQACEAGRCEGQQEEAAEVNPAAEIDGFPPACGHIIAPMSDLAKKIAARLKSTHEARAIQDEKFVEQQRLKRANGNGVWLEVRNAIITECRDINREMGQQIAVCEETASGELNVGIIINEAPRKLHVEFSKEGLQMHWNCGDRHGHWHLATMGSGRVTFVRGQEQAPISPEEIAATLIKILFDAET
jgi:hypothetical protein